MSSMIAVFVASLVLALVLTPRIRDRARRLGLLDEPSERRVHSRAMPRAGGIAIYLAFVPVALVAVTAHLYSGNVDPGGAARFSYFLFGATVVLLVGLLDDLRSLSPRAKLLGQSLAATSAVLGGVQVRVLGIPGIGPVELGLLAIPVTIVWFLLLINALNLIDGLDGLAAGIGFFATMVLLAVYAPGHGFAVALSLAALSGATLGFLRYNFNPASIFLGDSGSHLLGFSLAGLSVMGAVKTETAVGLLIPIVALGVPLIDALWAPVRRFILGRRAFSPDLDHIHHRLLRLGYTHRRAVLLLYGLTVAMGVFALYMVHARSDRTAMLLTLIAGASFIGIRRLGYFEFLEGASFRRWLGAVSDEIGLARERRIFLASEMRIERARDVEELWRELRQTAHELAIDACALHVDLTLSGPRGEASFVRGYPRSIPAFDPARDLQVSLPLVAGGRLLGSLTLVKELSIGPPPPHLLRRIEQLRESVLRALVAMERYGARGDDHDRIAQAM